MMRYEPAFRSTVVALALAVAVDESGAKGAEVALPEYPVCEASAAIEVACLAHRGKTCVWLADNEQPDHLFEYEVSEAGRLFPSEHWKIALDEDVDDIEALVEDDKGVLAIGSHGRNSKCEYKKKRVRVARIARDASTVQLAASDDAWQKNLTDCEQWIELGDAAAEAPARELRREACDAIMKAEIAAEEHAKKKDGKPCPVTVTPFNLEGAVSVPEAGGRRIWVGLRAPVSGSKAFLLRLVPLEGTSKQRIRFDGIAAIDLGGKGIRELTTAGDDLWGIAGTPANSGDKSFLWTVAASALKSGATISAVKKVGDPLPATSEGLVVQPDEKRAIVIIDGGLDEDVAACDPPAKQLVVKLSD